MLTIDYKKIAKEVVERVYGNVSEPCGNGDEYFEVSVDNGEVTVTVSGYAVYETSNYDADTNSADVYFNINDIVYAEALTDDITYDINNKELSDAIDVEVSRFNF